MASLIIAATAVMLLLSLGIIFFVVLYQRRVIWHQQEIKKINDRRQLELIQASIQGEEEERMRIAAELHDDVGATLSSVRLFLHVAQQDRSNDTIGQSKDLLDDSIRKIRNISHKLQPALLQQCGLQASLDSFAAMMSKSGNVKVIYNGDTVLPRLPDNVELCVYRVMQELTSNIVKHAGAGRITIDNVICGAHLHTNVAHDGEGLTDDMYRELVYKKGAIGLKNIVNRLKAVNGSIAFSRSDSDCFRIVIVVPLAGS